MKIKYQKNKIIYSIVTLVFIANVLFGFSSAQAAYSADTLVAMTNSARASSGLGALSTNSKLVSAAYAKANDMLALDYFAHNSPDGKTPWDFIKGAGYNYTYAGENLAIGYTDASELFDAWMNSATHRENILSPNFREIGMAVVSGEYQGSDTLVVVQEFGAPAEVASEQVYSATPAPTEATPAATPSSNPQAKNFSLIKEKSEIKPKNIFVGEEVTFAVTVSGEVQTLEAQLFQQKINLLNSPSVSTNGSEKTYHLTQKMDQEGTSEVKILAMDKAGNHETISLGQLTVNQAVITKGQTHDQKGLIARVFSNQWAVYGLALIAFALFSILVWFIVRRMKSRGLTLAPWRL